MSRDLILAADVGNTRVKFGAFEAAAAARGGALPASLALWAAPIAGEIDWHAVTGRFEPWQARIVQAFVAGVNPGGIERLMSRWPQPVWPAATTIERAADLPLSVNLERPDWVGIDRLLDAVAANVLRRPGEPAIVIDAGTATTVDLVSADGSFEGGAILPGLELGARALHQYTALLPLIDVPELLEGPKVASLGKNTPDAIRSGLLYGQIGAIRELAARLADSVAEAPLLLVTGGNGRLLAAALGDPYRFEPDLALRALAWVGQQS
jgi:type III pantothenate kinase